MTIIKAVSALQQHLICNAFCKRSRGFSSPEKCSEKLQIQVLEKTTLPLVSPAPQLAVPPKQYPGVSTVSQVFRAETHTGGGS